MNFDKKGPYILILLLVVILIFILGVQYGKRVKVADTAIAFLLSITPSPSPKPSRMPVVQYDSYSHKECNVTFLYPSYLKLDNESSQEAKFVSSDKKQFIKIKCAAKLENTKESTNSARITMNGYPGSSFDDKLKVNNETIAVKVIRVNRTVLPIEFVFNKELEPLITTSIEFE